MPYKILKLKRSAGVAGQISYTATVDLGDGEAPTTATFVGSVYGGPVVYVMPNGHQVFVRDGDRFGDTFGEQWVRRFFGQVTA